MFSRCQLVVDALSRRLKLVVIASASIASCCAGMSSSVMVYADQPWVTLSFEELSPTDSQADVSEGPLIRPISATTSNDQIPPAVDLPPLSENASVSLFQNTIPARKMTIRRDPPKNRFLGNDASKGQSIRSVQDELKRAEVGLVDTPARALEMDWNCDLPYGKYIYIRHNPLLFEDIPAERYGEGCYYPGLQPLVSFTKFMGTIPILPYKITTDCYAAAFEDGCDGVDHHGNLRPGIVEGSFLPSLEVIRSYPHANLAGTLAEGGTVAGLFFILP